MNDSPGQPHEPTADERFEAWWTQREKEPWTHKAKMKEALRDAWLAAHGLPVPLVSNNAEYWTVTTGIRFVEINIPYARIKVGCFNERDWPETVMTLEDFLEMARNSTCIWPSQWLKHAAA